MTDEVTGGTSSGNQFPGSWTLRSSLRSCARERGETISCSFYTLTLFAYGDVQLHEGPMRRQFEENHARFLKPRRRPFAEGISSSCRITCTWEDMGGWYDLTGFSLERNNFHGFIAGHSFGQVPLWSCTCLCSYRFRANSPQDQPPGEGIRRDTRSPGKVLCRLQAPCLHLRQAVVRSD